MRWLIVFFLLALNPIVQASESEPVRVEILSEHLAIEPGTPFTIALQYDLQDDWHIYWKNPGDAGMAPEIEWILPEGFSVSDTQWPTPTRYSHDGIVTYGYDKQAFLLVEVIPPLEFLEQEINIQANIRWVACSNDMCLPGSATRALTLPINANPEKSPHAPLIAEAKTKLPKSLAANQKGNSIELHLPSAVAQEVIFFPAIKGDAALEPLLADDLITFNTDKIDGLLVVRHEDGSTEAHEIKSQVETTPSLPEESTSGFWAALGLAFVGGAILNLMPCVLPVVSLKILSFVKLAGSDRVKTFKHGLGYSLGVLLSFWALAIVLLTLQAYGNVVGWGFQLQNPGFVALLIAVIFTFALSLFGVFEMGMSLQSAAGKANGNGSAILSGVLATAVATPCTGPFMGTALGIAAGLSAPLALLVFTSLGLGMASPYLILSAFPGALRFLPKPGNWMITFKEFTGFFMVATALWLLWVFSAETSSLAVIILLFSLFFFAIGAWVFGKWGTPIQKRPTRYAAYVLSLSLLTLGGGVLHLASSMPQEQTEIASDWEPFSLERVAELQAEGTPVFIDFTAKWCLTCQANHLVLTTDRIETLFKEKGIVRMKADWTNQNEEITETLAHFGRNGVPLYVYFPAEGGPTILPQILTPDIIADTIAER